MKISTIESLTRAQLFSQANAASLAALAASSHLRPFPKDALLYTDKELVRSLYTVVSGRVALFKENANGEKKVIFLYGPGETLNEDVLNGLPAATSCEVIEDSVLLQLPAHELMRVMEHDFALTKAILDSMAKKVRRLYRQLKNTPASIRGDKRLAAKLWKLSADNGRPHEGGTLIDFDLSVTYLADMLGAKRETVSRQLHALKSEGLVRQLDGRIFIPDRQKLSDYFKRVD